MSLARSTLILLVTVSCYINQSLSAPSKRFTPQEKRTLTKISNLEKGVAMIEEEYIDVLKSYDKLKSASPAEYAFYCSQFKSILIKAIEEENLGFKSKLSRIGYYGFISIPELSKNSSDPLHKFKTLIAPKHIYLLESNRSGLSESDLTKKADKLISQLKDMRSIVI